MNMQDSNIIQLGKRSYPVRYLIRFHEKSNRFTRWFFHSNLSPEVTLTVIFLGFGISFIHKAYLFLVILNRLPEMFNIFKSFS